MTAYNAPRGSLDDPRSHGERPPPRAPTSMSNDSESRWRVSAASAEDAPETAETPPPIPLNPWLTMWWAPRRTVRSLVASEERPSWIPVVALAGINSSLLWLLNGSGEALRE